jgi:hypothetical protein
VLTCGANSGANSGANAIINPPPARKKKVCFSHLSRIRFAISRGDGEFQAYFSNFYDPSFLETLNVLNESRCAIAHPLLARAAAATMNLLSKRAPRAGGPALFAQ